VVSPYGHILTNNHVVENAARVMVTYEDKEIAAQIVAQDAALDIAILLAPGIELPAAPLGDSDSLQVGEYAIVIGNPLGQEFERTVTVGYVSAIDREVRDRVSDRYGRSATVKNQMIQVDAAINEGNSGGGMFNTLGQLQGVPARKYDAGGNSIFGLQQQASVDNIGMCIPINVAKPMLKTVLESYDENAIQTAQAQTPAAPRPMIGVTVRTLTAGEAQKLDGTLPNGAYVVKVEPNSPAQAAGIKKGDIIVEADGEVLTHSTHLIEVLAQHKEGDAVKLKIFRAEGTDDVASLNTIGESEYVDLEVMLQLLEDVTM
jgi:serine protease Do